MKEKNRLLVVILLMTIMVVVVGCGTTGRVISTQTEVRIGAILPLTGWGAYWGIPALQGMNQAAAEINSHPFNHARIIIVAEDSKGEAKDAVTAAQKLISEGVIGVDVAFAPPALAASPVFETRKMPFIYDAFPKSILLNPYAFKSFLDAEKGCGMLVQHAEETGSKKIRAILSQQEYSKLCLKGARTYDPNISVSWYQFGDTDFRTLLLKAKQDDIDTILIIGWADEFLPFFQQKSEMGYDGKVLCGSGSECLNDKVLTQIPVADLVGVSAFDFANLTATSFAEAYQKKYSHATAADITAAAHGYEAVMLFAKAAAECEPITKECVAEHLGNSTGYPSALRSTGFRNRVLQVKTVLYGVSGRNIVPIDS